MTDTCPSLLTRLRDSSDAGAWQEFLRVYGPFVRNVTSAEGIPRDFRSDVSQDALLQVVRTMPEFDYRPATGRFRSWLAGVVRHRCRDWFRKRNRELRRIRRMQERNSDSSAGSSQFPADLELMERILQLVRRTSSTLSWQCFERHCLKGQSAQLVGAELGTSVNSVYLHSSRLMRRMRLESSRLKSEVAHELSR